MDRPSTSVVLVSSAPPGAGLYLDGGNYVDYAASKGALDALCIGLSRELAAQNIPARQCRPRPGLIETEIPRLGRGGPGAAFSP